jgi:DNA-binding Lrp family transcriptional regulator
MDDMHLDGADRKLLGLLQAEFPLSREPYADLGLRLGVDRDEVIRRIKRLRAMGIVRQISSVLDARRLGYRPTLVAMRVKGAELERAEQLIFNHPGISHSYERDHYFNLWFTLATPAGVDTKLGDYVMIFSTREPKKRGLNIWYEERPGNDLLPTFSEH